MSPSETYTRRTPGLPDPEYIEQMYSDVPSKRLFAWVIDVVFIGLIVGVLTMFSFFTALFFLPFLFGVVSFFYRWGTIASGSATPGMRIMAIGLRTADGERLTGSTAFFHTAGYFFSVITFPLQLISMAMMVMSSRKQGLTDMVLGTVALNQSAR
jgi:uncharacterized RDD family membrane protein YckC